MQEEINNFILKFEEMAEIIEWNYKNNCNFLKKTFESFKEVKFSSYKIKDFLCGLILRK